MGRAGRIRIHQCFMIIAVFMMSALIRPARCASGDGEGASSRGRMLIRVELDDKESFSALRDLNLDLASRSLREGAYVIADGREREEIERRGFSYEILIDDPSKVRIDPEFRDYDETVAYLDTLHQLHPDLTVLVQVGESQEFAIPIWALKISDNPDVEEDEPEILYTGTTHAREPLGNEICLGIATQLLEGYGMDPDITTYVDEEQIWIVPIVNTEGFTYMMDNNLSDPWWRKNQRDNNENGVFDEDYDGVDLNRNYDFHWDGPGGSGDPSSWVYRGPSPFSESETSAIRNLSTGDHRFIFSISYHSFGEVVIWPWEWPGHSAPDADIAGEVALEMASRITRRSGFGTYDETPGAPDAGYSDVWLYGVSGSIDFTVETCDEFIPAGTAIDTVVEANIPAAFFLLERVLAGPGITGHVTESGTGDPLEASVIVLGRDTDDIEPRTCEPDYGRYFRMLPPGVYDVLYEHTGYADHIEQITVTSDSLTVLDVELSIVVDIDLAQIDFDDDEVGQSDGNGDGFLNPGETIELSAWLKNVGVIPAYSVSCSLSTDDTLITIVDDYAEFGDLESGEIIEGDAPFVFTLSGAAGDGDTVSLVFTAIDTSSNRWTFSRDFTVQAPVINFQSMSVNDDDGGDGDGSPEAGETVDIIVALRNYGSAGASDVWAQLSSMDQFITIPWDSSYFGDMGASQSAVSEPPFKIVISPDVQDTHTVTLTLGIHALDYYNEDDFQIHLSPVGIEGSDEEAPLPRVTRLSQNYPNPFNPMTTIPFDLSEEAGQSVELLIFDVRGRLVRKLIEGKLEAGSHRAVWDGRNETGQKVSSGVYLYTLRSDAKIFTRRMVLLK